MNRENKNRIINPPILGTASLWNACGFKKSLSKRIPEKNFFEFFEIKKVIKKYWYYN